MSPIEREFSPKRMERASMSAADDVLEMKSITNELADRLVGKVKMDARVGAVVDAIRDISANRALEFLRGKASRVDAWEKERAKRQRDKLRSAAERQREIDHLLWLESELGRLRTAGEEFHGPHIDGLERVLRRARGEDRPVALSTATQAADSEQD